MPDGSVRKRRDSLELKSIECYMKGTAQAPGETGGASQDIPIKKVTGLTLQPAHDTLAVEEPLEIQLGYGSADARVVKSISVTMRTPGDDCSLAAGFLMTEGVVRDANDIEHIASGADSVPEVTEQVAMKPGALPYHPGKNVVRVELAPDVVVSLATLERNFYTTSSCGICGKASLLALQTVCPPRTMNTFFISASILYFLPDRLLRAQRLFSRTGGLHGAGLFDSEGELLAVREDVGRHNAVDKLLGGEFLADRTPLRNTLLLLSGRASFELLQKALMGGVSMVASVGAPSSLAVKVAKEFNISLVGFLRPNHFNIYHGEEHILGYTPAVREVEA
jgi:FdhD protein